MHTRLELLRAAGFHGRLLQRDDSLWGADSSRRRVASDRLGWVTAPAAMRERAAEFTAFTGEVAGAGFTRVLLLGMGGSSLAPEVLSRTFGTRGRGMQLSVLDDTSPASVRAAVAASDPARTLVLVASKSGGTIEVSSFERVFFARAQSVPGPGPATRSSRSPTPAPGSRRRRRRSTTGACSRTRPTSAGAIRR